MRHRSRCHGAALENSCRYHVDAQSLVELAAFDLAVGSQAPALLYMSVSAISLRTEAATFASIRFKPESMHFRKASP